MNLLLKVLGSEFQGLDSVIIVIQVRIWYACDDGVLMYLLPIRIAGLGDVDRVNKVNNW